MSSILQSASRHGTHRASHLRQVSTSGSETPSTSRPATATSDTGTIQHDPLIEQVDERKCVLWVHDEAFSRDEVVLNLSLFPYIKDGDAVAISAIKVETNGRDHQDRRQGSAHESDSLSVGHARNRSTSNPRSPTSFSLKESKHEIGTERRYMFIARDMSRELKIKNQNLEISLAKHVADVFGFKHRSSCVVSLVCRLRFIVESPLMFIQADLESSSASHVEMAFRDEYLARSDMWRLTVQELADKTIYKGQKIVFMGTIKVHVTAVYVNGQKVHSAFFSTDTKPIFRSESARYVLFIQMSREMWDFDSEGSGEIMFNKVVNGFLPALFKKWAAMKAKHLVSIVLFTRMEYNVPIESDPAVVLESSTYHTGRQTSGGRKLYKDFYRVVVSEMASGSWTTILYKLKREFRFFRRDTFLHRVDMVETTEPSTVYTVPNDTSGLQIDAEPSLAMHGNVLEAIDLASTQFSHDYIDRDLIRTGISVVIITPCAGLFEVDYETLCMTTESLIGNGIGIDLVCLPKMPLHSVPLFKYKNPDYGDYQDVYQFNSLRSEDSTPRQNPAVFGSSLPTLDESLSPSKSSYMDRRFRMGSVSSVAPVSEWSYAMPHWVDVSFWTGASQDINASKVKHNIAKHSQKLWNSHKDNDFAIRCKMYELEMASVMENAMSEISVPPLQQESCYPMLLTGPRDGILKPRGNETTRARVNRKKTYSAFHEFVSGPSKSVVDRHSSDEFKNFVKVLEAFDLGKSQVGPSAHHFRRNTDEFRLSRRNNDNASRRQSLDPLKVFGTSIPRDSSITGATLIATSLSSLSRQNSVKAEESTRPRQISIASITPSTKSAISRPAKAPRQISFGKHGFSLAAPKAAVSAGQVVNVSAAVPSSSSSITTDTRTNKRSASQLLGSATQVSNRPPSVRSETSKSSEKSKTSHVDEESKINAKPITLPDALQLLETKSRSLSRSHKDTFSSNIRQNKEPREHMLSSIKSDDDQRLRHTKMMANAIPQLPATLSPTKAMSAWLTVLNPANPAQTDIQSQYRRWHHIFPKRLNARTMKWKSLCCPASVPLTTSEFPSKQQLDTEYQQHTYTITHGSEEEGMGEHGSREEFLREMISLRLSHGFQIVVGSAVGDAFGQKSLKIANVFRRDHVAEDGVSVFMTIGNIIHQLSCVNETDVEVNMFVRKPSAAVNNGTTSSTTQIYYNPAIKTTLAFDFESRLIAPGRYKDEYNWNTVDSYIAGLNKEMTENLRFWRARFVLIPMQRPTQTGKKVAGEDDEEETRLEGIRKITQAWQRNRVFSEEEKRELGPRSLRDPNPLDIVYKTEDPSLAVTAELDSMLPLLEAGSNVQRKGGLIETERFRKSKLDIAALAAAIQAPVEKGGIQIQTRPWHWKHHHNCFIGLDMTTWLLENFADIHTREEAVEFGNKLMYKDELNRIVENEKDTGKDRAHDTGLFIHVDKRHAFRDGQYFYRIVDEYSNNARPESRGGWFSQKRRDVSVPPTPVFEQVDEQHDSGHSSRSRSSSHHEETRTALPDLMTPKASSFAPTNNNNTRPKVALSKVMTYDVDHRKRSYRPERINLHYDRLHNPDNCYHIRIDWVSVTAKLIEDAITSWAATAERYGLRLVEAPIGEACSISDIHPFRSPYIIKLALQPPEEQPATYFDTSMYGREKVPHTSRHFYHKHIMKKFNFVLDIEAAKNFPTNVDVMYSWGKPDFKYTQYIHRSGIVLAQITNDGDFLLLANRLYNNRTAAAREAERNRQNDLAHNEANNTRSNTRMASSMYGTTSIFSDRTTPVPSPALRPTITTHSTSTTTLFSSPLLRPTFPSLSNLQHLATSDVLGTNFQNLRTEAVLTPELVKKELETFCADVEGLEQYYQEVYDKACPPTTSSPAVGGSVFTVGRSPSVSSAGGYGGNERDRDVPALGLGPNLLSKDDDGKPKSGAFKLGNVMPAWGRRGSVQLFGKSESRDDGVLGTPSTSRKSRKESETDSPRSSISEISDG